MITNPWHDLYAHMEWADSLVWAAVASAPSPLDPRLQALLSHMHQTQDAFLQLWQGETRDIPNADAFASAAHLRSWARRFYPAAGAVVRALDSGRLSEPVGTPWAGRIAQRLGRTPANASLGDTLLQIVIHGAHHRAQINSRLHELGLSAPSIDYIVWVWLGRPSAEWPADGDTARA